MNSISVRIRHLQMVFFLLFPLVGATFYSQASYTQLAITPWQTELLGSKLVDPLFEYLTYIGQKRANPSELSKLEPKLKECELKVQSEINSHGKSFHVEKPWGSVLDSGRSQDPSSLRETFSALRKLHDEVSNSSSLILDPDLDSYWLMNAVVVNLPSLVEHLSDLVLLGVSVGERKASEPERNSLLFALALCQNDLDQLKASYGVGIIEATKRGHSLSSKSFSGLETVFSQGDELIAAGKKSAENGMGFKELAGKGFSLMGLLPDLSSSTHLKLQSLVTARLKGDATQTGTENVRIRILLLSLISASLAAVLALAVAPSIPNSDETKGATETTKKTIS